MTEAKSEDLLSPASRIRKARFMRGMKQSELCTRAQISSGYLSQLEQGDSPEDDKPKIKTPGPEIARRIALQLNVPVAWLLYGDGPEPEWEGVGSGEHPAAVATGTEGKG